MCPVVLLEWSEEQEYSSRFFPLHDCLSHHFSDHHGSRTSRFSSIRSKIMNPVANNNAVVAALHHHENCRAQYGYISSVLMPHQEKPKNGFAMVDEEEHDGPRTTSSSPGDEDGRLKKQSSSVGVNVDAGVNGPELILDAAASTEPTKEPAEDGDGPNKGAIQRTSSSTTPAGGGEKTNTLVRTAALLKDLQRVVQTLGRGDKAREDLVENEPPKHPWGSLVDEAEHRRTTGPVGSSPSEGGVSESCCVGLF